MSCEMNSVSQKPVWSFCMVLECSFAPMLISRPSLVKERTYPSLPFSFLIAIRVQSVSIKKILREVTFLLFHSVNDL